MQELTNKQKVQEDLYKIPYHWYTSPEEVNGRIYFGYLSLCLDYLKDKLKKDKKSTGCIKVLDAGCGDGRFMGMLSNYGVKELYGVDYSQSALSFAKILVPTAKFSQVDLSQYVPVKENYFDIVFLIETLEHIPPDRIYSLLDNLAKAMKEGGTLVVTVPSSYFGQPKPGSKHYQHFSEESLRNVLSRHFKSVDIRGQDKAGFHFLKVFYKFVDNRYWRIKPLTKYYNKRVWPKLFNVAEAGKARRLIAVCKKL